MSVNQCSALKLPVDGTLAPERKAGGLWGEQEQSKWRKQIHTNNHENTCSAMETDTTLELTCDEFKYLALI